MRGPTSQARMEKSVFTHEYTVFLALLRETRQAANVTQVQFAERIGETQSYVSKLERGELRVDLIQLRTICRVLGTSLPAFVLKLEERLAEGRRPKRGGKASQGPTRE